MNNARKQEIEAMITDLLMARGYLESKGKGFKEKGIKNLEALYSKLHSLKDTL